MKLLIESLMVFLGTLMAAAVVALGEPASAELALTTPDLHSAQAASWLGLR
ncbi:hypothetical protein [Ramlibacter sp.]|uniref:hypothetical protein n=1 Tax=Ramlibacter sp. TaxID=1917967 RepID=UPI001820D5C1|nr:hypothetical protein [Ramlibacter sp.]MBA2674871.1 hypothetical protein [Ramlibacter sp.]